MGILFKSLKDLTRRVVILLFPLILLMVSVAGGEERVYYSIHLKSFKDIKNANRYVNKLKNKGKLVFWKEAVIPEKGGLFYRVYLGQYKERDEAVQFWEKLNEEGAVGYFGVHEFKEEIPKKPTEIVEPVPEKPEADVAKSVPDRPELVKKIPPIEMVGRFIDNRDGTITDTKTNMMWIKNGWRLDFFSAVSWWNANKKCEVFRVGGYTDWRLPTIHEWETLIDTDHQYPALIEPNPFENIIAHMPYWSKTDFTYSSGSSFNVERPFQAYTVMLFSGTINHQKKNENAFILPVRSIN